MKSVSHCQYTGVGVLAHAVDEKGVKRRVTLADVRAGVVFPTGSLPGYFCLFGRKWEELPSGKRPLLFLTEGEHIMHEVLFEMLTDACSKFKCKTVYAHMQRQDRKGGIGGFDDLWRYIRNKKLPINVIPAPAAQDVEYGKALLREYWMDKAIDRPPYDLNPTTFVQHTRSLPGLQEVGKDESGVDEEKLYAFHAFRFLICGFVKFNNVIQYESRPVASPKADARGWT